MADNEWRWRTADDPDSVHALICTSDLRNASPNAPAPQRDPATTEAHVAAGNVFGLFNGEELIATFTVTDRPPHGIHEDRFPAAGRPAYLQRLAIQAKWADKDALIGVRCVRKACEMAEERGSDALRAEVNPDLKAVLRLLESLGFSQSGPVVEKDGRRTVYLHYPIP